MIKIEISSEIVEIAPNNVSQVTLTVTNTSQIIDFFTVSIEPVISPETMGLYPGWVEFNQPTFSLRPAGDAGRGADSTQVVIIKVNIPPQVYAGNYAGKILVTAKSGADNSIEIPFNIVISQIDAQTLEIQPIDSSSRKSSEIYRVIVSNQGNAPHIYSLYAEDPNDDIKFTIDPPEVPLRPGEQAALTLKAQPRQRNWVGDDVNHDFKVKMEGSDQEVRGSFKQKAAIAPIHWFGRHWGRFVFFLALLLVLLIVGAIFLLPLIYKQTYAADCAPISLRNVNVLSNGTTTNVLVSGRNGAQPYAAAVTEQADKLPGIFGSLVSISPDGRRIAYVTASDLALNDARIWIKNLDTDQAPIASIPITSGLWPVAPVWSANGEKLAYVVRHPTPVTASGTVTATPPPASGNISGTTATTATTTTAATTAANGTPGADAANNPSQLDLFVVSKIGEDPKLLSSPPGLEPKLFYGDTVSTVPLCWGSDDNSLLVRPQDGTLVQVALADGKFQTITPQAGGFQFPKPSLPSLPGLVMPLKSLVGVPASFLRVPEAQLASVQQQARTGTPTTTQRSGTGTAGTNSGSTPTATNPANECSIARPFSQNDPRWADLPLRDGSANTLAELGCPITAAAILLNYQQVDTTPSELTSCLGNLTSPLNQTGWFAIGQQCGGFKLSGGVRADFSWDLLDSSLQKGPTIVGLLGGPSGSHFLVVTGGFSGISTSYTVTDPWDGTTYKTLDYFLSKGYQPRWIISYEGTGAPCVTSIPDTTNQVGIRTTGAVDGGLYQTPQPFRYELTGASNDSATASIRVVNARVNLDDSTQTLSPSETRTFSTEGNYTIAIVVKDPEGKTVLTRNIYFTIDHTAPVIGNRLMPAPDKTTNKSPVPVSVNLLATDDLSGIASIEYQVNGGQWQPYTSDTAKVPLTISDNGTYTINYRATDGAGNTANAQTINFIIEKPVANTTGNGGRGGTGANGQVTPTVNPSGAGGAGGAGGAKTSAAALSVPTVTPIPTQTPRPAVKNTPTPVPTVPPTTIAPTPTITGTSLLPTGSPEISPTATVPLPTTEVITPTATVALEPVLVLTGAPITFLPDMTPQQLQIQNNGNAPLVWTLSPGSSSSLIGFSTTAGTVAVGGNATIDISVLAPNLTGTDQNTTFTINSNGGSQTVGVVIQSQPLPSATLTLLPASTSLNITNTIQVNVTVPNTNVQPNHIDLYATYKDCVTSCTAAPVKIDSLAFSGNTLTTQWGTSNIIPQTGISLSGTLCMNQDCSVSQPITPLSNLSIDMSATLNVSSTSITDTILPVTATLTVSNQSERTKKVVVTILVDNVQVQQLTADTTNNWTQTWDTSQVSPSSTVVFEAVACNAEDDTGVCLPIPSVTGYHTTMSGTVTSTPDLSVTKSLTNTVSIVVTPTANVKSVTVTGFYAPNQNAPQSNQTVGVTFVKDSNNTTFTIPVDPSNWPTQSGITLNANVCFNQDGTDCIVAQAYTGLFVPAGDPAVISDLTAQPKYTIINTAFPTPLSVKVTDAKGNPVEGVQVNFTPVNVALQAGALFSQTGTLAVVVTGPDGIATVPTSNTLVANGFEGTFTVNVSIPGPNISTGIFLSNTTAGAKPMAIVGNSDKQVAKIGQKFATPLQVQLDGAGAGISVTFVTQPTGVGATFPGGKGTFTAVTDASGIATAGDLTANPSLMLNSANYPIVGVHSVRASANGYTPILFTLTNIVGDPFQISPVLTSTTAGVYDNAVASVGYTTTIDTNFPDIAVQVKDIGGNLLQFTSSQNIQVQFTANAAPQPGLFFNNSAQTSLTVQTGGAQSANPGVAIATGLKANLKAGAYNVTATVVGFPGVTTSGFNFVNTSGAPASVEISTPPTVTVQAGTAYTGVIQAIVYDKGHNTVANSPTTQVKFSSPLINDRSISGIPSVTFNDTNLTSTVYTTTVAGGLGVATVSVPVIGTCALGNFQVTATLVGVTANPSALNMSIVRGDPKQFSVLTGDNQHTRIKSQFATNLATTLQDGCGNFLPGQQVSFSTATTTTQPGGNFNSEGSGVVSVTVTTDANGLATAPALFANTVAVKNTSFNVVATSLTDPSVQTSPTFKLFNDPGVPKTITPYGPGVEVTNPLSVTVGTKYTANKFLHATVLDEGGNPVFPVGVTPPADTKITFFGNGADPATGVGAAFDTAINSTFPDDNGVITSTLPFTTTNKVGSYTVTAKAVDTSIVGTFYMANIAGAPTQIIPNPSTTSTNPLQATVTIFNTGTSTPFNALSVQVFDQFDNVIPGASVTFTSTPTLNNANHLATANFGTVPVTNDLTNLTFTGTTDNTGSITASPVYPGFYSGNYPIIAQSGSITTTFYMLNLPDTVPQAVNITASSATLTTTVNTAFPKFSAFVTDVNGNGINSINVTFTIQGTGASGAWLISPDGADTIRPTNGNGYAIINNDTPNPDSPPVGTTDLQANTVAGPFNVVASVEGASGPITKSIQLINVAERKVTGTSTITFTPPTTTSVAVDQTYGSFNVFITDQYGNPIGSYPVTFTVPGVSPGVPTGTFGGSSANTKIFTDDTGHATVASGQLTAGTVAGNFNVTANIPVTETSATFYSPAPTIGLTNLAGVPDASHITTSAGATPVKIVVGQTLSTSIVITVADKYNNPIASPTLSYTISPAPSASPTVASADFTTPMVPAPNTSTGVNTISSITANTVAGNFTIIAHANGVASTSPIQVTNIPDYPAVIGIVSGNNQTPEVGQLFTSNLVISVTDQFGNLVGTNNPANNPNLVVFTAPSSGQSAIFTNTNNVVSNVYTGTVNAGGVVVPSSNIRANNLLNSYNITMTVPGITLSQVGSFTITNTADISLITTTTQIKNAGGEAFTPLQVKVAGAGGTGVPGLPVTFTVSDPQLGVFAGSNCQQLLGPGFNQNGTTTTLTVNTDSSGVASAANFCSGTLLGNYVVTATTTIGGVSKSKQIPLANTAQFSNTVTGNNQTAVANGGVFSPLGVTVIGYNNNPVPNVQVSYSVTNTTYAVLTSPQPITTNSGGLATANYTAGSFVGTYNVNATLNTPSGTFTQTFTLSNTVGVAFTSTAPTLLAGSNNSNGQTIPITAQVQDGNGNGLPNVSVQFAISAGDTSKAGFSGASAGFSDANGYVTVTLQAKTQLGVYTITATPQNGSNPAGTGDTLQGTTSANLTTVSAPTPLAGGQSVPVSVTVKGFNNVNISNAGVKFSVPPAFSGYGSVPSTVISSTGGGVAQTNLTTGNTAGTYNVLATLDSGQFNPGPAPAVTATITATNRVNIAYNTSVSTLLLAGGVDGSSNPVLGQTASIVFTATGFTGSGVSGVNIAVASNNKNRGYFQGGFESGNVITGTTSPTDSNGNATATLTAGNEVGIYTLTAIGQTGTTQISTNSLTITGTTTASLSTPSSLVFIQAGGDTQPISITVTGNSGALVNNAPVLFSVNDPTGLSNLPVTTTVNTTSSGLASLYTTSLSKLGYYTVTGNLSLTGVPLASLPPAQNITVVNTATISSISAASPLAGTANIPITATVKGFNNTLIPGASVVFTVPTTYNTYANFNGNQSVNATTGSTSPNTGIASAQLDTLAKAGKFTVQADLNPSQFGGNWNPTTSASIPITNLVTLSISSNPASPNLLAASNSSANNGATAVVTATVVGAGSVAVSNVTVNFAADDTSKGNVSPNSKDTNGVSKTVTTTLTASNGLGSYNVTAQAFAIGTTDDVGSGVVSFTAKTQAVFSGGLTVSDSTPLAGGDTTQVTATVAGKGGQAVEGATVVFTSSDTTKGTITTNTITTGSDGKATATVTTGSAVGSYTISAGLLNNPTSVTANTTLTNTVTVSYGSAPTPLAGGGTDTFTVTANGFGGTPVSGVDLAFTGAGGTGTVPGGSATNVTTGISGSATVTVTSNSPSSSGGSNNNAVYGGWTLRAAAMSGSNNVSNNGSTYNIPVTNTLTITSTTSTPPRPVANGGTATVSVQVSGAGSYHPNGVTVNFSTSDVSGGATLCGSQACGTVSSSANTSGTGTATPTVTARTGTTVSPTTAQSYDVQAQINIGGVTANLPTAIRVYNTVKVTATQTSSNLSTSAPLTVTVQDNQNNNLDGFNVQFTVRNQANTAVGSTSTDGWLCINTCVITSSVQYLGIRMTTVSGKAGLNYAQTVQTASTTGSDLDSDYDVVAAGTGDQGVSIVPTGGTNHVFNIKAVVLMPGLPIDSQSPTVSFNLKT